MDNTQLLLTVCLSLAASLLLIGLSALAFAWLFKSQLAPRLAIRRAWAEFAKTAGLHFPSLIDQGLRITGLYRGRPLRLTAWAGTMQFPPYTRATIEANFPARIQLEATRRKPDQNQTGHTTLDQLYTIHSQPAALTTLILHDPTVHPLLLQHQPARLFLDHKGVTCQLDHIETETAGLQHVADLAWETAEVVSQQIGNTIPTEEIPEEPVIPYSAAPRLLLAEIRKGNPKVLLALLVMLPSACLLLVWLWRWLS
jgi:hypothetical protein